MRNVLISMFVVLLAGCQLANPGTGTKVGQVARVNNEGLFCTTSTVLITGKFGGGELTVTVPAWNQELMTKVIQYQDTQEMVEIKYHTDFVKSMCSNETSNRMLDSIAPHHVN